MEAVSSGVSLGSATDELLRALGERGIGVENLGLEEAG